MFALCALTIWGIVPWDLTAFPLCDLLLAAAILGGCTQRCRQLGRSRGDQSGSQPGQSKWPSTPTHAASGKKDPLSELEHTTQGETHPTRGLTIQQVRWEQHLAFIQKKEEQRMGPEAPVNETPRRRPRPSPAIENLAALPPSTGQASKCQERARAAGSVVLQGLQEIPEEQNQNPPLRTSQWMAA